MQFVTPTSKFGYRDWDFSRKSQSIFIKLEGTSELSTYDDFNGTPCDLGRDVKSLEETSLLRTHTRVLRLHNDINRSNSSSSGRGGNLVFTV